MRRTRSRSRRSGKRTGAGQQRGRLLLQAAAGVLRDQRPDRHAGARQGGGALPRPATRGAAAQSRHRHRRPQLEEAVWIALKLERACRVQLMAEWAGGPKFVAEGEDLVKKNQRGNAPGSLHQRVQLSRPHLVPRSRQGRRPLLRRPLRDGFERVSKGSAMWSTAQRLCSSSAAEVGVRDHAIVFERYRTARVRPLPAAARDVRLASILDDRRDQLLRLQHGVGPEVVPLLAVVEHVGRIDHGRDRRPPAAAGSSDWSASCRAWP